jgi:hypothetical protein
MTISTHGHAHGPHSHVTEKGGASHHVSTSSGSRRYWVLSLLSLASLNQCNLWITFSPIAHLTRELYGWSDADQALFLAWGPIAVCALVMLVPSLVHSIGLRASITVSIALSAIAAILRCYGSYSLKIVHIAQLLNAIAGPIVLATPSKLSAIWFAAHERDKATSISTMTNYLGGVVGYSLSLIVTHIHHVQLLLYWEAVASVLLLFAALIDHAWPATPMHAHKDHIAPTSTDIHHNLIDLEHNNGTTITTSSATSPSSQSPSTRSSTWTELCSLCSNHNFMIISIAYGICNGSWAAWSSLLWPLLQPLGFQSSTVGIFGTLLTLVAAVGGMGFAHLMPSDVNNHNRSRYAFNVLLWISAGVFLHRFTFTLMLPI